MTSEGKFFMSFVSTFPNKKLIAEMTAKMLLEVDAVRFNVQEPFIFTSGWASPVYTDCRKLISYPRIRHTLMDFAASLVLRDVGFEAIDAIAGGETAGIPFAAWIADRLMLPMQYVRKKPKGFGRKAQIEGDFRDGDRILLVEDLTTDGQSKINFCQALRLAGAQVSHTLVIFYYDIFPQTKKTLADLDIKLHYLATWWDVLQVCKDNNYYDPVTLSEIESFLHDPIAWSAAHGGVDQYPV
jgi:orotate phosphoribosyltransferase